jgi:ADP-ribosylation factor GTPase-activating protein 1
MLSVPLEGADADGLTSLPGNNRCVECDALKPDWASLSYGTLFCLQCAGQHRGLGTYQIVRRSGVALQF